MNHFFKPYRKLIVAISLLLVVEAVTAQAGEKSKKQELFALISSLDSSVFTAFNTRNVVEFKNFFSDSLEFYHDKGGFTGYNHSIKFLQDLAENPAKDLRRYLVKEKLEVFPIPGYGAMQIGEHSFCNSENGQMQCSTFKFVHIWQQKNNTWKITRVVSYNH